MIGLELAPHDTRLSGEEVGERSESYVASCGVVVAVRPVIFAGYAECDARCGPIHVLTA